MKILYCDPAVRTSTSREYRYYDEVFNCLSNDPDIELSLHRLTISDGSQVNAAADLIVFGLGWFNHGFFTKIPNLNIPSVCILFKPQNNLSEKLEFCRANNVSRIMTPIPSPDQYEKVTGIKTCLFPYGYCEETFKPRPEIEKDVDVGFSGALHGNSHYPIGAFPVENIREKIGQKLENMKDISTFWKSSDTASSRISSYEEYAKKICSAKIWIATQAAFGDITPRYYEVMSSGTLLMCQKIPDQYKHILIHGQNCVEFENDLSDFEEKVILLANDHDLRRRITDRAVQDSREHTWSQRSQRLVEILREITNETR